MFTFFITTEARRSAQDRAAELDISRSNPPGQRQFVWDNRLNCVKRWYDYGSVEGKIGTIYFTPTGEQDGSLSIVKCSTELAYHPSVTEQQLLAIKITDSVVHSELLEFFFQELLSTTSTFKRMAARSSRPGTGPGCGPGELRSDNVLYDTQVSP